MTVHSQFMHLCERQAHQHKPSFTLSCWWVPGHQSPTLHESWPCLLSDRQLVHPQESRRSCFQWRTHLHFWSCCSHRVLGWCFQLCAGCWDCLAKVPAAVCNEVLQHAWFPVGLAFTNQMLSDLILLPFRHVLFKLFTLWVLLQPCWPLLVSKLQFSCPCVWVVLVICLVCLGWIFCFHFFDQISTWTLRTDLASKCNTLGL